MMKEPTGRRESFRRALEKTMEQWGALGLSDEMKKGYLAMAEINLDWCRAGIRDDLSSLHRYEMNLPIEEV